MTPRRLLGFTTAAVFAATLAGCATLHVYSFIERGADVSRYRTYDWAVEAPQPTGDPRLDSNPFFDDRVHVAVEKELARKWIRKGGSCRSAAAAALPRPHHAGPRPGRRRPNLGVCGTCTPTVYDAGTLLLDLWTAAPRSWSGAAGPRAGSTTRLTVRS